MLTDSKIKATKPKEKPFKLADAGGLYLLINTNGSKYWRMKYRFLKKEKLLSIGTYPTVSLADARKARELAKEQLLAGIDPNLAKQQKKLHQHTTAANSFKVIAQEWYDKQINIWAPSTATKQLALLNNDIYLLRPAPY